VTSKFTLRAIGERLAAHRPDVEPSERAARRAAVAVILRQAPRAGPVEALFIQRAEHPLDPWSGHMAFPGGHQDQADEGLEAVAIRETREEVGLALSPAMLLGRLDDVAGGRLAAWGLSVSPFVFACPERVAPLRLSGEVADAVWVSMDYLADPANIRPYRAPRDPEGRLFPSLPYLGRYTIWGMTYRMVAGFLNLFGVRHPAENEWKDVE